MTKPMPDMDQVYREHSRLVYRYLLSRCQDPSLAEELTQETFYRAVKNSERFDGSCPVSTWLVGIAKNLLKEEARRRPKEELTEEAARTEAAESEALPALLRRTLLQGDRPGVRKQRELGPRHLLPGQGAAEKGDGRR